MSKLDKFPLIERSAPLVDLEVGGKDKRTVTAYAATFGNEYPVNDFDGDYDEMINRSAFNRHLGMHGLRNVTVLYNHGLTMWGTPSDKWSTALGEPLEVKPEQKGLLTVTRYNNTDAAEEVLEMIRSGSVKAQSFRGPIIRSAPRRRGNDGRTKIERLEMGLVEYGPAPRVANTNAEIVALRSALLTEQVADLTDEEREYLRNLLADTPTLDPSVDPDTPTEGDSSDHTDPLDTGTEPLVDDSSDDLLILANAQRRRR